MRLQGLRYLFLFPLVVAGINSPAAAQPSSSIEGARVRTFTRQAEAEAKGDGNALILALDRRVRAAWGDFESFPVSIVKREDISVTLTLPYMRYRQTLADYLRIGRAIRNVEWMDTAVVHVSPERVDGPDITSIALSRNGSSVPPVRSGLVPMTFMDGTGKTAALHAGDVHFPVVAFGPGATVRLAANRATGDPFVLTLEDDQLRVLK